ncbi:hypothetical protein [Planomonospora algeriensis]
MSRPLAFAVGFVLSPLIPLSIWMGPWWVKGPVLLVVGFALYQFLAKREVREATWSTPEGMASGAAVLGALIYSVVFVTLENRGEDTVTAAPAATPSETLIASSAPESAPSSASVTPSPTQTSSSPSEAPSTPKKFYNQTPEEKEVDKTIKQSFKTNDLIDDPADKAEFPKLYWGPKIYKGIHIDSDSGIKWVIIEGYADMDSETFERMPSWFAGMSMDPINLSEYEWKLMDKGTRSEAELQ